jgi:hypothetical protein
VQQKMVRSKTKICIPRDRTSRWTTHLRDLGLKISQVNQRKWTLPEKPAGTNAEVSRNRQRQHLQETSDSLRWRMVPPAASLYDQTANHHHAQSLLPLTDPRVAFHRSQSRVHQEDVATEVVATMTSTVDSIDLLNQGSRVKDLQVIIVAREHRIETPEIRMGLRVVIGTIVRDLEGLMLTSDFLVKSLATLLDVSLCLLNKCLPICHHGKTLAQQHPSGNL